MLRRLRMMINAERYLLALYDLEQQFRAWDKYGEREAIPTEEIRETFYALIEDHHVDLDDLE